MQESKHLYQIHLHSTLGVSRIMTDAFSSILIKYVASFNTEKQREATQKDEQGNLSPRLFVCHRTRRMDVGRRGASRRCSKSYMFLGAGSCWSDFPKTISVTCDTVRSWAAELVQVWVAIPYTGWNANPKKLKGKTALTKESSYSTPWLFCPFLAEASSTYTPDTHGSDPTEVFPFDILVDSLWSSRMLSEASRPLLIYAVQQWG